MTTFDKIICSGQIGHLGYRVCQARAISSATFSTADFSDPASYAREAPSPSEITVPSSAPSKHGERSFAASCVPFAFLSRLACTSPGALPKSLRPRVSDRVSPGGQPGVTLIRVLDLDKIRLWPGQFG